MLNEVTKEQDLEKLTEGLDSDEYGNNNPSDKVNKMFILNNRFK